MKWFEYSVFKRSDIISLQASMFSNGSESLLQTFPVPPYRIHQLDSIVAVDRDGIVSGRIEIGLMDGSSEVPIDSVRGPFMPGQSLTVMWPCLVMQGQSIYAKFLTPAANDRLRLLVRGRSVEVDADEA